MNNSRKNKINELADKLRELLEALENVTSDEEESRDRIPDDQQDSDRYEEVEIICRMLREACDGLREVTDTLDEVVS